MRTVVEIIVFLSVLFLTLPWVFMAVGTYGSWVMSFG
jgi:hypothetical protein